MLLLLLDSFVDDLIGLGVVTAGEFKSLVGVQLLLLCCVDEVLILTLKSMEVFSFGNNTVWLLVGVPARPVVVVGDVNEDVDELETMGRRPKLSI